jgi:hypothetical protein
LHGCNDPILNLLPPQPAPAPTLEVVKVCRMGKSYPPLGIDDDYALALQASAQRRALLPRMFHASAVRRNGQVYCSCIGFATASSRRFFCPRHNRSSVGVGGIASALAVVRRDKHKRRIFQRTGSRPS